MQTKIVTTQSVVISTPLLDAKGKKQTEETRWAGRKVTHIVHEHTQHLAGTILSVPDELAKELIASGVAREPAPGIDDESGAVITIPGDSDEGSSDPLQ